MLIFLFGSVVSIENEKKENAPSIHLAQSNEKYLINSVTPGPSLLCVCVYFNSLDAFASIAVWVFFYRWAFFFYFCQTSFFCVRLTFSWIPLASQVGTRNMQMSINFKLNRYTFAVDAPMWCDAMCVRRACVFLKRIWLLSESGSNSI